jgi:hypothetical protein
LEKAALSIRGADKYKMLINDEANEDLCIAMCLAFDADSSGDFDSPAVLHDHGNIGPEERAFDSNWQPITKSETQGETV